MQIGTIYCHTNIINGKKYIGQTTKIPYTLRWKSQENSYRSSSKFYNAIKKYGWQNFKHEVIEQIQEQNIHDLLNKLNELEEFYIIKYDSIANGYNQKSNGENHFVSDVIKEKCKHTKDNKEWILNLSKAFIGRKWFTDGRINVRRYECPEGFVEGITKDFGKPRKKRITKKDSTGKRIISDEHRKALSESHKGKQPWNKGKEGVQMYSHDRNKKISESRKGKKYKTNFIDITDINNILNLIKTSKLQDILESKNITRYQFTTSYEYHYNKKFTLKDFKL